MKHSRRVRFTERDRAVARSISAVRSGVITGARHKGDVMLSIAAPSILFSPDISRYLAFKKLDDLVQAKMHWLFILSGPGVIEPALRLHDLYTERCTTGLEVMDMSNSHMSLIVLPFPRNCLSVDEVREIAHVPDTFDDHELQAREFILLVSGDTAWAVHVVSHLLTVQPILN